MIRRAACSVGCHAGGAGLLRLGAEDGRPGRQAQATPAHDHAGRVLDQGLRDLAPVFDAANSEREALGVTEPKVFRDADKPEHLLVMFRVASRQQGVAWILSPDLNKAGREGGVIGTPTHRFAN